MAKGDWTIWVMIIAGVLVVALLIGGIAYGIHKLGELDNDLAAHVDGG